jgi:hypothetical protein
MLEMDNGHDRASLGRACRERWAIPRDKREIYMKKLDEALLKARNTREVNSCLRTIALLERLNLDYDTKDRLDAGQATEAREYRLKLDHPGDLDLADALSNAEGSDLRAETLLPDRSFDEEREDGGVFGLDIPSGD